MSRHSKEPWRRGKSATEIVSGELNDPLTPGETFWVREAYGAALVAESMGQEDIRRTLACVNALALIPTETLEERLESGELVESLAWRKP